MKARQDRPTGAQIASPLLLTGFGSSPPALLLHHRHERINRRCTRSLVADDERIDLDLMNRDRGAGEGNEPHEQLSHRVPIAWHPGAENPFFHPESSHLVTYIPHISDAISR